MMQADDLRKKTVAELRSLEIELVKEQFNLRMQKGSKQLTKNHLFRQARHNVARIKTILAEKAGEA